MLLINDFSHSQKIVIENAIKNEEGEDKPGKLKDLFVFSIWYGFLSRTTHYLLMVQDQVTTFKI